jgi:hypothetical protein
MSSSTTSSSPFWDLLSYKKEWVVVPNGSYRGYFDWIPIHLRVGPWSRAALVYALLLWCSTIGMTGYYHSNSLQLESSSCSLGENSTSETCTNIDVPSSSIVHRFVRRYWSHYEVMLETAPVLYRSWQWWYHALAGLWMLYICYSILVHSPLSYGAWVTYTVQSWTLLTLRHVLCALAGWDPTNTTLRLVVELLRFPCAAAHTITFVVWNGILTPYILLVAVRSDAEKRRKFLQFCTSVRLVNLHFFNIIFCVLNVWLLHPTARTLEYADLYLAGLSAIFYFTWYLCFLDRLGIHLYPIFSPRHSNLMVCSAWTGAILLYFVTFKLWQYLLPMNLIGSTVGANSMQT